MRVAAAVEFVAFVVEFVAAAWITASISSSISSRLRFLRLGPDHAPA